MTEPNMSQLKPAFLRRKAASAYSSIPLRTLDAILRRGKVVSYLVGEGRGARGRCRLVDRASLEAFVRGGESPQSTPQAQPAMRGEVTGE